MVPGVAGLTVSGVRFSGAGVVGVSPGIETTVVIVDEVHPTLVEVSVQGTYEPSLKVLVMYKEV